VALRRQAVEFDFPAKSNQRRVQSIRDPAVKAAIGAMRRRRSGPEDLLVFKADGEWRDIRSVDVNEYIHEYAGEEFSAKDFRTWHGTVLAAVGLAVSGRAAGSKTARERAIARTVKEVAHYLGNTPAVCRASYVLDTVIEAYDRGRVVRHTCDVFGSIANGNRPALERSERSLVALLRRTPMRGAGVLTR